MVVRARENWGNKAGAKRWRDGDGDDEVRRSLAPTVLLVLLVSHENRGGNRASIHVEIRLASWRRGRAAQGKHKHTSGPRQTSSGSMLRRFRHRGAPSTTHPACGTPCGLSPAAFVILQLKALSNRCHGARMAEGQSRASIRKAGLSCQRGGLVPWRGHLSRTKMVKISYLSRV